MIVRWLSVIIYGCFLVATIRHVLLGCRRLMMHPMRLFMLTQWSLVIDFMCDERRFIVCDATVFRFDGIEMRNLLIYLSSMYRYVFDDETGTVVRISYNYRPFQLLHKSGSAFNRWKSYKLCTLDTLPFNSKINEKFAKDVRRILKSRVRVDL